MIFVPSLDYKCYTVIDKDTIRAYEEIPSQNSNISYRDFYVNSHYLYKDGNQQFNPYTSIPTCIEKARLTDNVYYRNDIDSILIIFIIFTIFAFYIPLKIFSRFAKRGRL